MCSSLINHFQSCYLDNFGLVAEVFGRGIVLGLILGTVVGVLLLFIKHIKD